MQDEVTRIRRLQLTATQKLPKMASTLAMNLRERVLESKRTLRRFFLKCSSTPEAIESVELFDTVMWAEDTERHFRPCYVYDPFEASVLGMKLWLSATGHHVSRRISCLVWWFGTKVHIFASCLSAVYCPEVRHSFEEVSARVEARSEGRLGPRRQYVSLR